ncbi:methyltransferase family protein [Halobacteriovorax sp. RT-2-4]|uniref:methyltransferase family protein n=1 Tax=unclassified Halobacteriovorax TaxID=2639665 RepID=UPI00399A91D4
MTNKTGVLTFGVISYLVGFSALVGWIGSMLGLIPFQYGIVNYTTDSVGSAFAIAIGLTSLFAIQHTVMARQTFKRFINQYIPAAAERSLYVLMSGITLHCAILFWPKNGVVLWNIENSIASTLIMSIGVAGWAYLFVASFALNHFELFGLEQTYNYYQGKPLHRVPFQESWMYSFDRHPIMTGALIGMWFTPQMTVDHLMFSGIFSAYIIAGVSVEERDLVRQWGTRYMDYRSRVKTIVPTFDIIGPNDIKASESKQNKQNKQKKGEDETKKAA